MTAGEGLNLDKAIMSFREVVRPFVQQVLLGNVGINSGSLSYWFMDCKLLFFYLDFIFARCCEICCVFCTSGFRINLL